MKLRVAMLNAAERDAPTVSKILRPVDSQILLPAHNVPSSKATQDANKLISPHTNANTHDSKGTAPESVEIASNEPEAWTPRIFRRQNE
jgi:hypothetical protein